MNDTLESYDVSSGVSSDGPVVCERSTYWTPPGGTEKVLGTSSIGGTDRAFRTYLPEGSSAGGFETWILVANTTINDVMIDITYQTSTGLVQGPHEVLPLNCRKSYRVNDTVEDFNVSAIVSAASGKMGIMCERAVYWTPPGGTEKVLGTSSIGFAP